MKATTPGTVGETMNVSEVTATNLLVGVVLGMSGVGAVPVNDEEADLAARFLGNRAGKTSDGALDSEAVAARWARRFHSGIPVCERCREVRDAAARCDGCGDALCEGCWGDGDALVCGVCRYRRRPPFEDAVVTSAVRCPDRLVEAGAMTAERVAALTRGLEGRRVSVALVDGSRIDDCELICAGRRGVARTCGRSAG